MPAATFASIRSVHAGFAGWVLVAILLHAILLMIPSKQVLQPGQVHQRLTIWLQATAREESVFPTTSPAEVAVEPQQQQPQPEESGPITNPAPARPLPALASKPLTRAQPSPSAAQLLDLASRLNWQAPPSGETYCGRTEAWSPLNPLFESIMTWRPCGGGGTRDFEVPERYHKASRRVEPR